MWYAGSQYFLHGEAVPADNSVENSLVGWPIGTNESGTTPTSGSTGGGGGTPPVVFPTDVSKSAIFLVTFIVLGILVGIGLGIFTARLSIYRSEPRTRVKRTRRAIMQEILEYISTRPAFTIPDLADEIRVPQRRVERYVRKLIKCGLVRPAGREGQIQLFVYVGEKK